MSAYACKMSAYACKMKNVKHDAILQSINIVELYLDQNMIKFKLKKLSPG